MRSPLKREENSETDSSRGKLAGHHPIPAPLRTRPRAATTPDTACTAFPATDGRRRGRRRPCRRCSRRARRCTSTGRRVPAPTRNGDNGCATGPSSARRASAPLERRRPRAHVAATRTLSWPDSRTRPGKSWVLHRAPVTVEPLAPSSRSSTSSLSARSMIWAGSPLGIECRSRSWASHRFSRASALAVNRNS